MTELRQWIDVVASTATAIGVFVAAWQLFSSKRQERTVFEDSLAGEYRRLCQGLPVEALLGGELTEAELNENLAEFFHYFTLTNDQIFMRSKNRVTAATWSDWASGISMNLRKPAFFAAWERIGSRSTGAFLELRRFLRDGESSDPRNW